VNIAHFQGKSGSACTRRHGGMVRYACMRRPCVQDMSFAELRSVVEGLGEPPYRAGQVYRWLYGRAAGSFSEMSDLPAAFRLSMERAYVVDALEKLREMRSRDGTRKFLLQCRDGKAIEAVVIPAARRRTVCLSTQVGCRFGCPFCASGMAGFDRNLSQGEMLGQVVAVKRAGIAVTHVVFMGIGEPLDNYGNVARAVSVLNDGRGFGIGARRITVSTCGLADGIERLAREGPALELSVSLHAPEDALRDDLVPVNRRYPLKRLLAACRKYSKATKRVVTFEYVLLDGVNDSPAMARKLAVLLGGFDCKVNLIRLGRVPADGIRPSPREAAQRFLAVLRERGFKVTMRRQRGADIEAACGQLRLRSL
jgi:23S rRNA (adenine2503-C2)-methyltransferase